VRAQNNRQQDPLTPTPLRQGERGFRCGRLLLLAMVITFPGTVSAAEPGAITGKVDRPGDVTSVKAVDREGEKDKVYPGKIDPKTGAFTIPGLPLGKSYDVVIDAGAIRLEGINLKVPRSDYEEEQPLGKEDIEALTKAARLLNQFEDQVEIMTITGNIQHAAVLLNKLRNRPFYESKPGEVIWRLELWRFEKPEETWAKVQDELFLVLYRERLQKADFDKKCLTLDSALGGLKLTEKTPTLEVGKVAMPDNKPGIRLRKR
jgi:hypothetical protein